APLRPFACQLFQPRRKVVPVDQRVALRRPCLGSCRMGVEQARVQHDLRLAVDPVADEMPAVFIAHGNGREAAELARPIGINSVPRTVVAEARGIGDQPLTLEPVAEEYRLAAVPRVEKIPDYGAADD